jgi:hypothetical protein
MAMWELIPDSSAPSSFLLGRLTLSVSCGCFRAPLVGFSPSVLWQSHFLPFWIRHKKEVVLKF